MAMLSYKQYILMQENFGGVLGISSPTKLGLKNEAPMLGMMKKMAGDAPDMGMGGNKPEMGMGKPKPKPDMGGDPDDDMDDEDGMGDDDDDDLDGGDMDNSDDDGDEGDDMGDDDGDEGDDMGDDDGDEGDGDEGDDMGDDMGGAMGDGDEGGGADGGMMGPGGAMGGPPMGKKKPPMAMGGMGGPPMMKKMMGAMHMRKESSDPQDAKLNSQNKKNKANDQSIDKTGTAQKKTGFVKGAAKCCSKMSKKCCKMTKEQTEFNNSLRNQLGITGSGELKFTRDELGFWVPVTEDVLVKNPGQEDNEPQPGDVGYAPQQKLGMTGSNFQEWATYHKKQVKKNKKR